MRTCKRSCVVCVDPSLSARFPAEHACRVRVELEDGRTLVNEKHDYLGFVTRPMPWELVRSKFEALASPRLMLHEQRSIVEAVAGLEDLGVDVLCARLSCGRPSQLDIPRTIWRQER